MNQALGKCYNSESMQDEGIKTYGKNFGLEPKEGVILGDNLENFSVKNRNILLVALKVCNIGGW